MELKKTSDVRAFMKLTQQMSDNAEIKDYEDSMLLAASESSLPQIPVKDTEIVVETLIGNKSTGSKGLAAESDIRADDVIVSINGVTVSGA